VVRKNVVKTNHPKSLSLTPNASQTNFGASLKFSALLPVPKNRYQIVMSRVLAFVLNVVRL